MQLSQLESGAVNVDQTRDLDIFCDALPANIKNEHSLVKYLANSLIF